MVSLEEQEALYVPFARLATLRVRIGTGLTELFLFLLRRLQPSQVGSLSFDFGHDGGICRKRCFEGDVVT